MKLFKSCEDGTHKFEPRYDKDKPDISTFTELKGPGILDFVESMRKITYVRDICVKCGRTIERYSAGLGGTLKETKPRELQKSG